MKNENNGCLIIIFIFLTIIATCGIIFLTINLYLETKMKNKEINQTGDNAILFIILTICIGGIIAGYVKLLFF